MKLSFTAVLSMPLFMFDRQRPHYMDAVALTARVDASNIRLGALSEIQVRRRALLAVALEVPTSVLIPASSAAALTASLEADLARQLRLRSMTLLGVREVALEDMTVRVPPSSTPNPTPQDKATPAPSSTPRDAQLHDPEEEEETAWGMIAWGVAGGALVVGLVALYLHMTSAVAKEQQKQRVWGM